jgi:hypothetical protein
MPTLVFTKHGWLTSTSQYSTDRKQARVFEFPQAVEACTRLYSNGVIAVPVRITDLGYMK